MSNELNMTQGNIDANTNTFSLTNGTIASLDYTSGTIYDGEFQRNINSTGTYYFPVGISSDRNAITIDINTLTTAGSLSAEFVESDAGIDGLPLDDVGTSIVDYFTDGYWDMDARSGFATSDFDVTLEAESFNDYPIGTESRVLKRTNDGDWSLDGNHAPSIDPDINRNNLTAGISSSTTQFGIGLPNCIRFTTQPISITECLDENISFSVVVNSREGAASYQWQKNGFDIPGETAATLSINNITQADAAIYRCEVTNACGTDYSDPADLFISEPFSGFGYAYRRTITIDDSQIPGSQNLENYPLMVNTSQLELRHTTSGGNVENINGYDIAFVDDNGNKLDHQLESYSPTGGQIIAWVRIPSLSYNSSTDIYILYGNPQVTTDQSTERVWSSDYVAVWHLNNDFDDATFFTNNGANTGTEDIAGLMGQARHFEYDDGDDRIFVNGFDVYSDELTLSSWINMELRRRG